MSNPRPPGEGLCRVQCHREAHSPRLPGPSTFSRLIKVEMGTEGKILTQEVKTSEREHLMTWTLERDRTARRKGQRMNLKAMKKVNHVPPDAKSTGD